MHPSYEDITSRIAESPTWWDEGGVPRYGEFGPDESPDIYAREVVLLEISCQSCDTRFKVCFAAGRMMQMEEGTLADRIREGTLHYGDPPNTGCCPAGPTMNSIPIQVLEYWHKGHARHVDNGRITDFQKYNEWTRDPLLEGECEVQD